MATIQAEFDGRVFVPCEPLKLPFGTKVEVFLPTPPPNLTSDEMREWQAILQELHTTEPAFSTLDEALRYSRKQS
jgi:hypothetical protein